MSAPRAGTNGAVVGARLELVIDAVAHGGSCVARHEGRVVFVRHTLPGERVVAVVTEGDASSRFLRADAVEVLQASPDRVEEPCPYAKPGRCGGCDWQHATLDAQRGLKSAVVQEQLRRLAGVEREVPVLPVARDDDGLRWRSRVQWSVDRDGGLGLHRHRSSEVLRIDDCRIACQEVLDVGAQRETWQGAGAVEVVVTSAGDRSVVVSPAVRARSRRQRSQPPSRREGAGLQEVPPLPSDVLVVRRDRPALRGDQGDRTTVTERAAGRDWQVAPDGFWQVHPHAPETLVAAVLRSARPQPGETVLDLYAGAGLLTAAVAEAVGVTGQTWAVEGDRRAAHLAASNLADLRQVRVLQGDVEAVLAAVSGERQGQGGVAGIPSQVDVVVLDPPRSGAGASVCGAVASCRPRVVTYVACDPAALARDVATFRDLGYDLTEAVGYDIFPMTHHVEVVATLTRRDLVE